MCAPWSCAATSKAQRVRVEVFSKIRQIFLPFSVGCSERGVFGALKVAREIEQIEHVALGEIVDLQVAATLEIECHGGFSLRLGFFWQRGQ